MAKVKNMKGILLAGGKGSRLYPLTKTTSKQLLPVYDKPMIYYPLSTLMYFGIKDILIISTPQDTPNIKALLGDGKKLGLNLEYAIQETPNGIAQAFVIGKDFIKNDEVCLVLGDNIFYMSAKMADMRKTLDQDTKKSSTIFVYHVSDPERFGVVEFDKNFKAISIEEKPKKPKSNYASVGLYFYPNDVVQKAESLKPSPRGEYEITDLNNLYLKENRLCVMPMKRGTAWLDAGTPDSLLDASQYIQIIEKRQGLKIACLEEIAFTNGFINDEQMQDLINELSDCDYKKYLQKIYELKNELY